MLFSNPNKMSFSSILQVCRIILHQLYCVISADCQHDSDKPYVAYHSCSLKTISSCCFLCMNKVQSCQIYCFRRRHHKMHHRHMLAQLLHTVTEHNRNSAEILKCLKYGPFLLFLGLTKYEHGRSVKQPT